MAKNYEANAKAAVAKALGALRRERGLSRAQVASTLGVSRSNLYRWEDGTVTPTVANLVELAAVYDTSIADLVAPAESAVERARRVLQPTSEREG